MKKLFSIIVILTWLSCHSMVMAQKNKGVQTHTFTVKGNCTQCKERIEESVDLKGVKYAVWNKKSKQLVVTFDTSRISLQVLRDKILKSGHDVDSMQAPDDIYRKLPDCCKYRNTTCND